MGRHSSLPLDDDRASRLVNDLHQLPFSAFTVRYSGLMDFGTIIRFRMADDCIKQQEGIYHFHVHGIF